MRVLRTTCLFLLTLGLAASASAQLRLPDALQGDPLEDKRIGETPDNPFGPIHFFPLDGSVVDQITGVVATATENIARAEGHIGGAVRFDGTAYVRIPVNLDIAAMPDMTIVAMVRPDVLPDDPDARAAFYPTGYVFSDGEGLVYLGNHGKDIPLFAARSNRAIVSNADHPAMRGGWQMVALTRTIEPRTIEDGSTPDHVVLTLFTNGQITEKASVYQPKTVRPELLLGSVSPESASKFRGAIDHLSIYDRALSEEELRDMLAGFRHAGASRRDDIMVAGTGSGGETEAAGEDAAPTAAGDQRAEADPRAGIGAVGAADPVFTPPVATADETGDLIDSEAGQELLASADWRIVGMVPNSADKAELYPGDEVTVAIRVRKTDPANKIPEVRLVQNDGGGTRSRSQRLLINTNESAPEQTRDLPLTFTVPADFGFEPDAVQANWNPRVWLNASDGLPLRDADPGNHARELMLIVRRPPADADCVETSENADGTRTQGACLKGTLDVKNHPNAGAPEQYESLGEGLVATEVSGTGTRNVETRLLRAGADNFDFRTREKRDKPCAIWIGQFRTEGGGWDTFGPCRESGDFTHDNPGDLGFITGVGTPSIDLGDAAVTGLQLCHRRANDRVKGARLYWRPYAADGTLGIEQYRKTAFETRNCNHWRNIVYCPDGMRAVGVKAHWKDGSGLDPLSFLVGAQLVCAPLDYEP